MLRTDVISRTTIGCTRSRGPSGFEMESRSPPPSYLGVRRSKVSVVAAAVVRCERSVWYRLGVLRWLYWFLVRRGTWYVTLRGDEQQLWWEALRHAPPSFRWFGRSLGTEDVDQELPDSPEWHRIRDTIQPGDMIWPFLINPWTLAMRAGYVIVRHGKPVHCIVTVLS
ncbi:hypothetical protein Psta_0423 [Pirellula staleyi DSM 6068]|uniref:Uncharacterized protein n=1 Tax=Pirellula staleyi (strain ATCC 27377 / DSM 6068 / ICPB 4128) TaxID=530564 RepID=D2R382_PIRSD|nr:hypothetical protein Psta_0423 [Pirellula staleyi DSM 6068]